MARLSVITITLNEEQNITACLESVRWADEMIVVDSGSKDRTVEFARKLTNNVIPVEWKGYGATRNIALDIATGDWILWLDADERVTPELASEIREVLADDDPECDGYSVARRAYFLDKWIKHCGWYPSRVVRLFRKGKARFSEARVHEQLLIAGGVGALKNDLLHFTDPNLYHYFAKFNTYTTLAARELQDGGRHFSVADVLLKPPFMFLKMYILRFGILDGMHGFLLSLASSAYVFAKYAKLWELQKK
jgi:glycosyltransferase involved in cell wall biosynthesis